MNDIALPDALMRRIYNEYLEMPGLQLTMKQARRLFGLSEMECARTLEALVHLRLLTRLHNGTYAMRAVESARRARSRLQPHVEIAQGA